METTAHQEDVIRQFTRQAQAFFALPAHSEQTSLEIMATLAGLRGQERVLDVGCGPGLVSCFLACRARSVVGVDLTEAMVARATAAAAAQGLTHARFQTGNMAQLPFPDDAFDATVTRYTFHHLENAPIAFAEMVRVTAPGGRIVVADATPAEHQRERYDTFERARDPSHTRALSTCELLALGEARGLGIASLFRFRLPMNLDELLASSFPETVDRATLRAQIEADLGRDAIGFAPTQHDGTLTIHFPITALGWTKP